MLLLYVKTRSEGKRAREYRRERPDQEYAPTNKTKNKEAGETPLHFLKQPQHTIPEHFLA
jgi:hypothetical protein